MSEPGRKRVRRGELRRVRCRVCSKVINFQSYSDHLKLSHPEEDPAMRPHVLAQVATIIL